MPQYRIREAKFDSDKAHSFWEAGLLLSLWLLFLYTRATFAFFQWVVTAKSHFHKDICIFTCNRPVRVENLVMENWEATNWGNLCSLIKLNPESQLPLVPFVWTPTTPSSRGAALHFNAEVKVRTKVPFLYLPLWSCDKRGLSKDFTKLWVQSEEEDRGGKKYKGIQASTQEFSSSTANMSLAFEEKRVRAEVERSAGPFLRSNLALL